MKLTIHRGASNIGGTCIELQSSSERILIDFGLPLFDADRNTIDSRKVKNKPPKDPIQQETLPQIEGLYKNERSVFNAILVSHPHPDHYGLLSFVNPKIPVYMSQGCKKLIEVSKFFNQTECDLKNIVTVKPWQSFKIGSFKITPYLVDHSGFDAFAFLIESENKRVFYSGDFRGHGRKSVLFDNIIKNPPKDIDYLILEGSMLGRDKGGFETEKDIENELTKRFKNETDLFFIACSSQNIDRIVSIYRACIKSNRIFVIDPYTAFVLDELKSISPNIPQFDWNKHIRVFFVPSSYTNKMAENKSLFKFKSAMIPYSEIQKKRKSLVIKDSYAIRKIFVKETDTANTVLIYSMYEGYLKDAKPFWEAHNVPIVKIHSSGHAYIEELQKFAKAMNPKYIIPNHTFYPEQFSKYFGDNVKIIKDKEQTEL